MMCARCNGPRVSLANESRQCYEEALLTRIQQQLTLQDPERYLPHLALALDNLGALEANVSAKGLTTMTNLCTLRF
jgi:hypothetical protein